MLKIACSRRRGKSASKLGMIGSVVRVMAAAVAEVRAAGALRQQALQLVRANRSIGDVVASMACSATRIAWRREPMR